MTFEQFQATKTVCTDLGDVLQDARWNDTGPVTGLLYLGTLYIEDFEGRHYLILGREEWLSDDLTSLERRLYEFAVGEGYSLNESSEQGAPQ